MWRFHFVVDHEEQGLSVFWGWSFGDTDCCPATQFHPLYVLWRWRLWNHDQYESLPLHTWFQTQLIRFATTPLWDHCSTGQL